MVLSEMIIKSKSCKCMPLRCNFTRVDLQLIVQTKQCLRLAFEVLWQLRVIIFFFTFDTENQYDRSISNNPRMISRKNFYSVVMSDLKKLNKKLETQHSISRFNRLIFTQEI